jgi:hypothetical protein
VKKNRRLLTLLLLVLSAQAGLASLVSAQRGITPGGDAVRITGRREFINAEATVNFTELSRQEALNPTVSTVRPRAIAAPKRAPALEELPVTADDETQGTRLAESDTIPGPSVPSPAPASSFLAIPDQSNDGFANIPPDSHGAVGPLHLVAVVNGRVTIQDRTGVNVSVVSMNTFWSELFPGRPAGQGTDRIDVFDPRVVYDQMSERFVMCAVADAQDVRSGVLLAVSLTSNPTQGWKLYLVDADPNNDPATARWADFPSIGFNKHWVVVHANMFGLTASGSRDGKLFIFKKADLYAGAPSPTLTVINKNADAQGANGGFSMTPATTFDRNLDAMYLVQAAFTGGLRISRLDPIDANATPQLSFDISRVSAGFTWSSNGGAEEGFAPQKDSAKLIDTGDTRMQSVVVRNGSIWGAHTIFLPAGGSPTRASVQWWQLTTAAAPTLVQRGVIDDPNPADGTNFYAFPSLAVNANNDMLIGYSRFSVNQHPSANYAFRAGTDPANTLRDDTVLKAGEASYFKTFGGSSNRWGDYSNTVVDPANDLDMWTIQEYAATHVGTSESSNRWGTWWGRISLNTTPGPGPTPQPTIPPPANDLIANSTAISGTAGSVTGTNVAALKEDGEPSHEPRGNPGGSSVWYRLPSPGNGTLTINTAGSNYDTLLGVYTPNPGAPLSVRSLLRVAKNDDVTLGTVVTSTVTFQSVAGIVYYIAVDGFDSDQGNIVLNWTFAGSTSVPTVQFSQTNFGLPESGGATAIVTVTRAGDLSAAATVDMSTNVPPFQADCGVGNGGAANPRCDYANFGGTIRFAPGVSSRNVFIPIVDDTYAEGNETIAVTLSNARGATLGAASTANVSILDNDAVSTTSPLDQTAFFVKQQYYDFLSREPDGTGFAGWQATINGCPGGGFGNANPGCDRVHVSKSFYQSDEFQGRGYFAYRFYQVAFGRRPTFAEFIPDIIKVGGPQSPADEAASKAEFTEAFALRPEFTAKYDQPQFQSAQSYVNELERTAQVTLDPTFKASLVAALDDGTKTRDVVLRDIAETAVVQNRYFTEAFVAMQYFGYQRRDPDQASFLILVGQLNQDFNLTRKMVFDFIFSDEYRVRFGLR